MDGSSSARAAAPRPRFTGLAVGLIAAIVLLAIFPPFRIVRLQSVAAATTTLDPDAAAEKLWRERLPAALRTATNAQELATALARDPAAAAKRYARQVGIGGTAYYFVAGEGKIVA